jgi:hypothetical protein
MILDMKNKSSLYGQLAGDAGVIFVATLVGFLSHNESPLTLVNRFLATWVPFSLAWGLAAYATGLYRSGPFSIGLILLASILAAPLGALLRGLWLGALIQTSFVLVMAAVLGLGMILWRWGWPSLKNRRTT